MSRVRISTTVDGERLARARGLFDAADSLLVDRALAVLVERLEAERELQALTDHPYEDDPDLAWEAPVGAPLAYDGDVPAEVLELAAARRRRRR